MKNIPMKRVYIFVKLTIKITHARVIQEATERFSFLPNLLVKGRMIILIRNPIKKSAPKRLDW